MTNDLVNLFDCDETQLRKLVAEALTGADDGELFIEHAQAESLTFDNGRLKGGSFNTDQGFGLRAVMRRDRWLRPCGRAVAGCAEASFGCGWRRDQRVFRFLCRSPAAH